MDYLIPPEEFRTSRLLIRCYGPGDGPALAEAVGASFAHLQPWMPWARPHPTAEEYEPLARRFRGRWLLAEDFCLGLFSPDGSRVLGGSGFHLRHGPISSRNAEIGMWIRGDEAGAGLGTHALGALLEWGFADWPWERLVWKCDTANVASRRVAEKCGLKLEGIHRQDGHRADGNGRRDTAFYAILREEWIGGAALEKGRLGPSG